MDKREFESERRTFLILHYRVADVLLVREAAAHVVYCTSSSVHRVERRVRNNCAPVRDLYTCIRSTRTQLITRSIVLVTC